MGSKRNYSVTEVREAMARMADSMSSFDEMAAAIPYSQIDLKSAYPLSRLRDRITTTGGGNVVQEDGAYTLTTDSAGDSSVTQESVERGRYVAGFDALGGLAVAVETPPVGDQFVEWGYTDFVNGMAVGEDSGGMYVATYKGGVRVIKTYRDDWDHPLVKEQEGFVLDPRRLTVYRFTFRYYGGGPWRLLVTGDIGGSGQQVPAHLTRNPDSSKATPYIDDPNQPLSVLVDNNGTTGNPLTVRLAGRQFHVQGNYSPNRRVSGDFRIEQSVDSTFTPMIAFRQRNTEFGSISTKLEGVAMLSTHPLIWQVLVYAQIDSTNFVAPPSSDNGAESALEFCTDATTVTNGIAVYTDIAAGGGGNKEAADQHTLPTIDFPAQGDIVALVARTANVNDTATVTSVFRAREEW